jgi:hypothetical protein
MDDAAARRLFEATPHRHPSGRTPDWDLQPEHIRDVFRRKAASARPD